jgi:hypothetical protein
MTETIARRAIRGMQGDLLETAKGVGSMPEFVGGQWINGAAGGSYPGYVTSLCRATGDAIGVPTVGDARAWGHDVVRRVEDAAAKVYSASDQRTARYGKDLVNQFVDALGLPDPVAKKLRATLTDTKRGAFAGFRL